MFFHSQTVFILARLYGEFVSQIICEQLLDHRILLRDCANFEGLSDRFIRISLKMHANNARLVEKLHRLLKGSTAFDRHASRGTPHAW